ncbi:uncharacterized protein N7443_000182 [Penicillium atrosanguineum]|uniref:uncharacterized protein n=1 Tax=Penicillium atrosanguineum TaxID=1132637 RepID=UPI002387DAC8|nr:uncharacterized protein N7443_000182 [Penicillium atrosanguineum]KAJ5313298.1 hypothetical protein N7443_000182 [Penicillium atrosanguineum]
MSGSPPAELPSVTSGEPKPAYPLSSPTVVTTKEPASSSAAVVPAPLVQNEPQPAQLPPRYGEQTAPEYVDSPRPLPGSPPYPLSTLESSVPGPATRSLAQKSTRRTKAHVASACVNCKKKHLGCDPARPCRRCVLAGKASSCVDVTHKKRGRPPLKAEDSSLRPYTSHMEHPAISAEIQPSAAPQRNIMHRATSSRELRPMTDLQGIDEPGQVTAAMQIPRGQPHRWSASVFPLTRPIDPSTMPTQAGRRPFSASGPPTYGAPPHPPPAFVPTSSGFNPVFRAGVMPPRMERRFAQYPSPTLPPPTSPPQHIPASVPYSPYETPGPAMHQPMSDPRVPHGPRELYLESPLRLPPIHQATASPGPAHHHAHRLSDPYPATWTSAREDANREPRSPGLLHRPTGSIFSHSTPHLHQRSSSQTGPLDPVPRHLGPVELPSPVTLHQSPPTGARDTLLSTEAENQEPRPIKRRKMALDDMVNG